MPLKYTFEKGALNLAPWWMRYAHAAARLTSFGKAIDWLLFRTIESVKLRMAGAEEGGTISVPEKLALLGHNMKLSRGINEPNNVYAGRIARARQDHKLRGGPVAMLEQLRAYYAAAPFRIDLVYRNGRRWTISVAGVITYDTVSTATWDTTPEKWCRWRLFYDTNAAGAGDEPWRIPTEWNAAHCNGTVYVLGIAELWGFPAVTAAGESDTWDAEAPNIHLVNWQPTT